MNWLNDAIVILAISQISLLGLYFLAHHQGSLARYMSLFCVCMVAYLLAQLSVTSGNAIGTYLLNRLSTLTPFVLWLIAFHLFLDGEKVGLHVWAMMASFVLIRAIGIPLYDPSSENSTFWFIVIYFSPQLILLGFSIHSVYLAVTGYRADLVEQRRRARVFFVFSMGLILAFIVGNGFFSFVDPFLESIHFFEINPVPKILFPIYLLLLTLVFNLTIFRLQSDSFLVTSNLTQNNFHRFTSVSGTRKMYPELLERLTKLMEQERIYAQSGLTITDLAKAMRTQEYRIRRVINEQLNYQNFNQFLNHYRINEASRRLVESRDPVSTIALEVGYASLSTFNDAFKKKHQLTPSNYRKQAQAASISSALI